MNESIKLLRRLIEEARERATTGVCRESVYVAMPQQQALSICDSIEDLEFEIETLRQHISDCGECINFWGTYASTYFQEKHDLKSDIEKYRKLGVTA